MTSEEVKMDLYERVAITVMMYGSETWLLSAQKRRKIETFEKMCLSNKSGITKK